MASQSPIASPDLLPAFEYQGDTILATFEGRKIAEGTEFARVAATADEYLDELRKERGRQTREASRRTATHITTPNGLEGEILSRVDGLWGQEITVRLANGEHRRYITAGDLDDSLKYASKEPEAPVDLREAYAQRLSATIVPNREGLIARLQELDAIAAEVAHLASAERNVVEQQQFHQLVLNAKAEKLEVQQALDHLAAVDAENAAVAPPQYRAAEQADLGKAKGDSWLDVVASEMIAESEQQDFDKLASEGPTILVASLDDGALVDAGVVREIAQDHIMGKTAGFQGEKVQEYREHFVAAVEQARRQQLRLRQDHSRREAATQEVVQSSAPDDALFM